MKAKDALRFMLTCYVSPEQSMLIHLFSGEKASENFADVWEDVTIKESGEYFCFFSDDSCFKFDLEKCLECTGQKSADYVFPIEDNAGKGWWVLFKLED